MTTRNRRKHLLLTAAFVALLATLPASAADGDKSTVKGLITAVNGNQVTVKDSNNVEHVITLTSQTTYKKTKGLTGVVHEKAEATALMPGLPITADLVAQGDAFNATGVSFKAEDHRTAQQVQAGLTPTNKRMDDFGTYEALEVVEVHFASGSTSLSGDDQAKLRTFAEKAKGTNGYHVVLQGFTDSTGNAAANQRLSTMRAASVANFLQQQAGLMPGRVHAGDGMGIASDAGSGSNASARKVVVKLVVDKGVNPGN
jgi:outer membrane protein OmpA-like peptidoglycan-associated protein